METPQVCRLCLENRAELLNMFENFEDTTIASITQQYYSFKICNVLSNQLCVECWTKTRNFHQFYQEIESKHKSYFQSILNVSFREEEPIDLRITQSKDMIQRTSTPVQHVEKIQSYDICDSYTIEKSQQQQFCKEQQLNETLDNDQLSISQNSTIQLKIRMEILSEDDYQIRKFCNMECEICSVMLQSFNDAKEHYREKHQINGYVVCCGKKFLNRTSVMSHIQCHLDEKQLLAFEKYKAQLQMRKEKISEEDALIREYCEMNCDFCSKEFETFLDAKRHYESVHHSPGFLTCCRKRLYYRVAVLKHISLHINPEEYKCEICNKQFPCKDTLRVHIQNHAYMYTRPYKCNLCSHSFINQQLLKTHKLHKHCSEEDKKYICDICNKKYMTKSMIFIHMRKHTANLYKCKICERFIRSKRVLKAHMETHSTTIDTKLRCHICGSWLKNIKHLRFHITLHQTQPEECPICKKMFYNLQSHNECEHKPRSYQCPVCSKQLKSALGLRLHTANHIGKHLYKCPYCTKTFKSNSLLYCHEKNVHLDKWKRDNGSSSTSNDC